MVPLGDREPALAMVTGASESQGGGPANTMRTFRWLSRAIRLPMIAMNDTHGRHVGDAILQHHGNHRGLGTPADWRSTAPPGRRSAAAQSDLPARFLAAAVTKLATAKKVVAFLEAYHG